MFLSVLLVIYHVLSGMKMGKINLFLVPILGGRICICAIQIAFSICIGEITNFIPFRFAKHLGEFISNGLAPHNLEAKQIAGKAVKSHEMVDFFQRYLEIFNGDEIPEPKSIFNTTAEVTNLHALNSSREMYVERMEGLKLSSTSEAIIDTDLAKRHQENLTHSLQLFQVVNLHSKLSLYSFTIVKNICPNCKMYLSQVVKCNYLKLQ